MALQERRKASWRCCAPHALTLASTCHRNGQLFREAIGASSTNTGWIPTYVNANSRWKHALFIAIDANFRLRRKDVSNDERDPGLNQGLAYLVDDKKFRRYLDEYLDKIKQEKTTCSTHDAIKSASIRGGRGIAASGLGAVVCSRHDMRLPVAAGDLHKGEKCVLDLVHPLAQQITNATSSSRYVYMDYFVLSALRNYNKLPRSIVVSYDIACQWTRNWEARCELYPSNPVAGEGAENIDWTFCVPKFHLAAHVGPCQLTYSFNLTPGVGRLEGEAPERLWVPADRLAPATMQMGPGARRDVVNDDFGDGNWSKVVGAGMYLLLSRVSSCSDTRVPFSSSVSCWCRGSDTKA